MRYIPRLLEKQLTRAARHFPALILTGPRRAGKTTVLRRCFPNADYWFQMLNKTDLAPPRLSSAISVTGSAGRLRFACFEPPSWR